MAEGTSSARDGVLGAIRRAAAGHRDDQAARATVEQRLSQRPTGPIPARGQLPPAQRIELFVRQAQAVAATVERVQEAARIPHAVADYLSIHNLPARVRAAPDSRLKALDWSRRPTLEVAFGPGQPDDVTSLTIALAGVAETGTLFCTSGAVGGPSLAFLPGTNIVVLPASRIVGAYEEAWALLRTAGDGRMPPRSVNLITGPSRTADIEQTPQLHAHGPGRLHILIVGDGFVP